MKKVNIWVTLAGFVVATAVLYASPIMEILQDEDPGSGELVTPQLIWSTDPGIRYELQDSMDMESWSTVAGYPSEAAALAQQYELETGEDAEPRRFFRVRQLDEQPPVVINRIPGANTFGARRDSTISVTVNDLSGVDPASILLTVGDHGAFSVASPLLSFSSNVVTFSLGDGVPLGDWGSTQDVSLAVADILGNAAEYQWSFELETEPEVVADLFIFGSEEAQQAGQRLSGMPARLATRYGRVRLPASPGNDWQIASVSSNTIVLSYVELAPTSFAVNQLLANRTPASVEEIFYRRINAIEDDPDQKTYTLHTTEVNLSDLVLEASFSIGDEAVLLEFGPQGQLVQFIDFEETFQLPSIGADFTGEVLFTNQNYTLLLDEGKFLFHPYLKTSLSVDWDGVRRFEAQAGGNLEVTCVPRLIFQDSYSTNVTHELWRATHWLWGAVGIVPVGVEITATVRVEGSLDVSATADIKAGFRQYGNMRVGGRFDRNATPQVQMYQDFNIPPMQKVPLSYVLNGQGQATLALIPQLDVRVYGAAGIYMNVDPRVEISGSATVVDGTLTEADWLLGAYADVNAGLSVIGLTGDLPSISFELFAWEWAEQYRATPAPLAPTVIVRQPASRTVNAGNTAHFSVDATGSGPLSYQWYHNGMYLPNGARRELALQNVTSAHAGNYHVRVTGAGGSTNSSAAALSIHTGGGATPTDLYMVIDLSGGPNAGIYPVSYLNAVPAGGWTDEYKTTKLVLRRIPAGSFTMGSPEGELGRWAAREAQRGVTLTKDFYIGVFEVTQKQWERVMGDWPSWFNNASFRETRPLEQRSWNDIRGGTWPGGQPGAGTFMQRISERTGQAFDLPTESQWEYACRAGTTTALNSGKNLTGTESCPNMAEVGRYWYNGGSGYSQGGDTSVGTAKVGSYPPNAWGLYDMHGNVSEWCLDWYVAAPPGTVDPVGAASGSYRVGRGGGWLSDASYCRSAYRINYDAPDDRYFNRGFRISRTLP